MKTTHIHDRERKAAKCLGMPLEDYLRRKAVLLGQAGSLKKQGEYGSRIR